MMAERPDLDFVLVNNNAYQLDQCPDVFSRLLADMEAGLPLGPGSVDGVMFLYSLCHAEVVTPVLAEAARVVKPGGELFVFDYERLAGDNDLMRAKLAARAITRAGMARATKYAGWEIVRWDHPEGDDSLFRSLFSHQVEYELIFKDLVPVVWKARRV
jgi:SAM-dependent methyltransferase